MKNKNVYFSIYDFQLPDLLSENKAQIEKNT